MTEQISLKLTFEELEQIDKYIELNEDTRQLFDKIRKAYPKSPVEAAYKRVFGEYPPTTPSVHNDDDNRWSAFQSGYSCGYGDGLENSNDFAIPKKIVDKPEEKQPTIIFENRGKFDVVSQDDGKVYWRVEQSNSFSWWRRYTNLQELCMIINNEEELLLEQQYQKYMIERNLKTSLQELSNGDVRPINDVVKEAKKELVEKQPKTLTDILYRWWDDVFTTHSDWDAETSIEDLVDQVEQWLPKQTDVCEKYSYETGRNHVLDVIKKNLR